MHSFHNLIELAIDQMLNLTIHLMGLVVLVDEVVLMGA